MAVPERPLKIAALLPHVEVFGGVRRFVEIGNALVRRGHDYALFHPEGGPPGWLPFAGRTLSFSALGDEEFDAALCGEYSILDRFDVVRARSRFFYFLLEGHKREREVARRRDLFFLGNSEGLCRRMEMRYGIPCHRATGGINPEVFHPVEPREPHEGFRILSYGRIVKRRKGVRSVIRAAEGLRRRIPGLKLILFDTPVGAERRDPRPLVRTSVSHEFHLGLPQARMAWLFGRADVFVSAERRAGWANTAAEAMACGLPVVCSRSGTLDFARDGETALVVPVPMPFFLRRAILRLARDPDLRRRLAEAGRARILDFTWDRLAARLEEVIRASLVRTL